MSLWRQLTRGVRALVASIGSRSGHRRRSPALPRRSRCGIRGERAVARGGAPRRATPARQRDRRARAGARVRLGDTSSRPRSPTCDTPRGGCAATRVHATVACLTLALGIGASTAIFSAVNPVLFRAAALSRRAPADADLGRSGWSRASPSRSARFASSSRGAFVRGDGGHEAGAADADRRRRTRAARRSARQRGLLPRAGRAACARTRLRSRPTIEPNGPYVVIISDALWRRRFGADRTIVGRQIRLDDDPVTVIGVMPRGFENVLRPTAEIWAPLQYDTALPLNGREWGHHLRLVGRVRAGLDPTERSRSSTRSPERRWRSIRGRDGPRFEDGFIADPLQDELTRSVRPALLAVAGAVILLLAIACVNVTNLLLARGAARPASSRCAPRSVHRDRGSFGSCSPRACCSRRSAASSASSSRTPALARLWRSAPPELPRAAAIAIDRPVLAFAARPHDADRPARRPDPRAPRLQRQRPLRRSSNSSLRIARGHQLTRAFARRRRRSRSRWCCSSRRSAAAQPPASLRDASGFDPNELLTCRSRPPASGFETPTRRIDSSAGARGGSAGARA